VLGGLYLSHLAKAVVAPRTLPHSTIGKQSPMAWSVPLIIISLVIVRVVLVLR
jgi:hypothetical protein